MQKKSVRTGPREGREPVVASWRQGRPTGQKRALILERAGQYRVKWHLLAGALGQVE